MKSSILCTFLVLSSLLGSSLAMADLSDTAPWTTTSQVREINRMVLFQGKVVASTPQGGLLLVDPSSGGITRFNSGDGLSSDAISDMAVSPSGELWLATGGEGISAAGLCRLDASFRTRVVAQDLASLEITAVAADGNFVYYGTRLSGAGRLSSGVPEAVYTSAGQGLVDDRVLYVAASGGEAWFATRGGLSRLKNGIFQTFNGGLDFEVVRDLIAGPVGVFAADRVGVKKFDASTANWVEFGSGLSDSLRALSFDGDSLVGLGYTGTAWRLDAQATQWQSRALDVNLRLLESLSPDGLGHVWYGGYQVDLQRTLQGPIASLLEPDSGRALSVNGLLGVNVQNLVPDRQGGAWVSCLAPYTGLTHWRKDGSFVHYDYAQSVAGLGWCGDQTKFGLCLDSSNDLWVSNFRDCLTRLQPDASDDPTGAAYLNLAVEDSPLRLRRIRQIEEDPQGRIWLLSEGNAADAGLGIDIITDRSRPEDPTAWKELSPANSLLMDGWVMSVTFQPPGTAWICIDGKGVQRWDYDGLLNDGIMRDSQFNAAEAWDLIPYVGASSAFAFSQPRQVAVGQNGLIYIAAADLGVLEMSYTPFLSNASDRIHISRVFREGQAGLGLLSSNATGCVFDPDGRLWVTTAAGLNRLTVLESKLQIGAWTTVDAFSTFQLQLSGYRGEVISPMAGAELQNIVFDPQRNEMMIGSTLGVSRVSTQLDLLASPPEDQLSFVIYPNPYPGREGADEGIYLRGLEGSGPILVQIFDLQGTLITEDKFTSDELPSRPVWDVKDLQFRNAASGLYIVRASRAGGSATQVLAVER
jgi:ligand-binding sensor domain-containing protein